MKGNNLNGGKRACAVCVLWAATAAALPAQTLTTLYSFCAETDCTDGQRPQGGLVRATNGELYGTTSGGDGPGTVFKITPGGALTTLYTFCSLSSCADGEKPRCGADPSD